MTIDQEIIDRKGARKVMDISNTVLTLLNKGEIETVNLTEWLAIDHVELIENVFPDIGISKENITLIKERIIALKKPTTMSITKLVGPSLYELYNNDKNYKLIIKKLSTHTSDAIRCYAPYLISLDERLTLQEKFNVSKSLIADKHFGIREIVWMALRPQIAENLNESVSFLSTWTKDKDENIRRFTTEATRPRGVWCKHIETLKEHPEIALPILEELKADTSKYVQDSVGNWLNDASKTVPNFVINLCNKWSLESDKTATKKIIKRAKRTIDKK